MRQINRNYDFSRELEQLGVSLLSGESCNLGMRVTTDISPQAAPFIEEFLAVDLRQTGMNGWAKDPLGKWHSGRSKAWDYDTNDYREGWSTDDGFCIHLPRRLFEDLFIFLTLKLRPAEAIVYCEPLVGREAHGVIFDSSFILFEEGEYRPFMNNVDRIAAILEEYGELPKEDMDYTSLERYLAYWGYYKRAIGWRVFQGQYAHTNRHAWSGRKLV